MLIFYIHIVNLFVENLTYQIKNIQEIHSLLRAQTDI